MVELVDTRDLKSLAIFLGARVRIPPPAHTMQILLVDNGTTLLEKLKKLIPGKESIACFDSFSEKDAKNADVIILSGSSIGPLYQRTEAYRKEIEFIQNTNKSIIGICFGYELIVHAFSGELEELNLPQKGMVEIRVLQDADLFCGKNSFYSFANHRWGTKKMPDSFEILAESDDGPEVIRHTLKPIYGLQFHPENRAEESFGDELFLNILHEISRKR